MSKDAEFPFLSEDWNPDEPVYIVVRITHREQARLTYRSTDPPPVVIDPEAPRHYIGSQQLSELGLWDMAKEMREHGK